MNTELETEIQELRADKELLTKEIQKKNDKINLLETEKNTERKNLKEKGKK